MNKINSNDIKKIQLDMLIKFNSFCKENNLRYYLAGGSCLGAIRHNGFIPWDDDIDLMMLRSDYDKLILLLKDKKIDEKIDFKCLKYNNTFYPFGKLFRNDTYTVCSDTPLHDGIWIDIFPLDNVPSDEEKIFRKAKKNRKIILAKLVKKNNGNLKKYIGKLIIKFFTIFIPIKYYSRKADKMAKKWYNEDLGYVANILWATNNELMKKEWIEDGEVHTHEFEGYQIPIPANYDKYLSNLYGDYMKLPPKEKQVTHGYEAWYIKEE